MFSRVPSLSGGLVGKGDAETVAHPCKLLWRTHDASSCIEPWNRQVDQQCDTSALSGTILKVPETNLLSSPTSAAFGCSRCGGLVAPDSITVIMRLLHITAKGAGGPHSVFVLGN